MRIGDYDILPTMDKDYFIVRKYYLDGTFTKIKVCGGDIETVLSCLFIKTEVVNHD